MKIIKSEHTKSAASPLSLSIENWRYGPVLVIKGNTYSIKDRLKALGFKPYKWRGSWVQIMDKKKFDRKSPEEKQSFLSALKNEGIANLELLGGTSSSQIQEKTRTPETPPSREFEVLHGEEYPYQSSGMGKDKEEKTRARYSFPIEKNILQMNLNFTIDGVNYEEQAMVSRSFTPGKTSDKYNVKFDRGYKNFPLYEFDIGKKEDGSPILTIRVTTKGKKTQRPWGTYNEKEYLTEELKPKIEKAIENRRSFKNAIIEEYDKRKRDPDLEEFLEEIKFSWDEQHPLYDLNITEGPYKGSYPISVHYWEPQGVVLETALDHPLAPRKETLGRVELTGVHTLDELDQVIQQKLQDPKIQEEYVKYLQSFPYLSEQKEEETEKFNRIRNFIVNKSIDVEQVLQKIKEMGYIRPHKRQKQKGPGMTSGEEIKWILDANKIRDDIYERGFHKSSPDFFYTVVAYYVLKAKTGQWSWTDAVLMDSIRSWIRVMKKFGEELDFSDIEQTISAVGKEILYMVFGKTSKTRGEQFYDFYYGGGFFGDEGRKQRATSPEMGMGAASLENFARELGVDPQGYGTKQLYRTLSRMTHPDVNSDDPNAEEKFKRLQQIWDSIPDEMKQATNWYDKITLS